jgi:hypothetical protein
MVDRMWVTLDMPDTQRLEDLGGRLAAGSLCGVRNSGPKGCLAHDGPSHHHDRGDCR